MTVLRAQGVTKRWTPTAGLAPVDVEVDAGQFVAVRGRSGSGKSTLLALFAGWTSADAGVVEVDGRRPSPDEPWTTVAIVPQVLALAVELSVAENITDAAPGLTRSALSALLHDLGLESLEDRTIDEISMGQQQRVALARALAASPRAMLVDEPTSFQDAAHAGAVVSLLVAAARAGTALLVVTHDQQVIAAADRVIDLIATSR